MPTLDHEFTKYIIKILNTYFPDLGNVVLNSSELLQYLNVKTKAANRGSKSRASFANHYAIYVLINDYLKKSFHIETGYSDVVLERGKGLEVIEEIVLQSRVEFNVEGEEQDVVIDEDIVEYE